MTLSKSTHLNFNNFVEDPTLVDIFFDELKYGIYISWKNW